MTFKLNFRKSKRKLEKWCSIINKHDVDGKEATYYFVEVISSHFLKRYYEIMLVIF